MPEPKKNGIPELCREFKVKDLHVFKTWTFNMKAETSVVTSTEFESNVMQYQNLLLPKKGSPRN